MYRGYTGMKTIQQTYHVQHALFPTCTLPKLPRGSNGYPGTSRCWRDEVQRGQSRWASSTELAAEEALHVLESSPGAARCSQRTDPGKPMLHQNSPRDATAAREHPQAEVLLLTDCHLLVNPTMTDPSPPGRKHLPRFQTAHEWVHITSNQITTTVQAHMCNKNKRGVESYLNEPEVEDLSGVIQFMNNLGPESKTKGYIRRTPKYTKLKTKKWSDQPSAVRVKPRFHLFIRNLAS